MTFNEFYNTPDLVGRRVVCHGDIYRVVAVHHSEALLTVKGVFFNAERVVRCESAELIEPSEIVEAGK